MLNNIKTKAAVGIFILFSTLNSFAQQPLNLGFETQSVEGINRPWGWLLVNYGETSFTMDSMKMKSGRFSLKATCKNMVSPCPEQSIRYDMEPFELKDQVITVEGFIKTENITGSVNFSIGYTYLNKENNYSIIDTSFNSLSGSMDWTKKSISLFVPQEASVAYLKINYTGNGIAWFDDFKLKAGEKIFTGLKSGKPFTNEQMKWLSDHSAILNSTNAGNEKGNSDLELFKKTVGTSELVGLGESTHGTKEFFLLKNRLLQYAVTVLGFRVFALEDNQLAVEKINSYVLTGKGTAKESMSGLFDVWYRDEMLQMVEWVHSYNKLHPNDKVAFVGFDMQEIKRPVDSLLSFLSTQDSELYELYHSKLLDMKKQGANVYQVSDSVKLNWYNDFNSLLSESTNKKNRWLTNASNAVDSMKIILGIQYATLVKQFAENTYKRSWSIYRDEAMAENISWLKNVRYPGKKIIIWAHDVHISRCDHPNELYNLNYSISMGSFLSKKYGRNYQSFSLTTYQGSYSAMKSYTNFEKVLCPLFPGPVGTLDNALHEISKEKKCASLFLTLSREESWLAEPSPKRFANHVSIDYGYWERPSMPYQFDGIFFIDKTSGSTPMKK